MEQVDDFNWLIVIGIIVAIALVLAFGVDLSDSAERVTDWLVG